MSAIDDALDVLARTPHPPRTRAAVAEWAGGVWFNLESARREFAGWREFRAALHDRVGRAPGAARRAAGADLIRRPRRTRPTIFRPNGIPTGSPVGSYPQRKAVLVDSTKRATNAPPVHHQPETLS